MSPFWVRIFEMYILCPLQDGYIFMHPKHEKNQIKPSSLIIPPVIRVDASLCFSFWVYTKDISSYTFKAHKSMNKRSNTSPLSGLICANHKGVSRSYSGFTFTKIDTGLLDLTFRTNRNIFQPQLVFSWNLCKIATGSIFEFPIVLGIFLRPPAQALTDTTSTPRPLDVGFRACKDNRCRRSHRSVRPG